MKQFFSILFTFSFFIIKAQTITIWQGPSTGGGWSNAANWSNGVPTAATTEIIFDGAAVSLSGGNITITDVMQSNVNFSYDKLKIINNATVNLSSSSPAYLYFYVSIFIESGSRLNVGANTTTLIIFGGTLSTTININGILNIQGQGTGNSTRAAFEPTNVTFGSSVVCTVRGSIILSGKVAVISNATASNLIYENGASLFITRDGGTVSNANYKNGSLIKVQGVINTCTAFVTATYNGVIEWNCPSQLVKGSSAIILPSTSFNSFDSLLVINTNTGSIRLATNPSYYLVKNLIMNAGILEFGSPTGSGTYKALIDTLIQNGGTLIGNASGVVGFDNAYNADTIEIRGKFIQYAGVFDLSNRTPVNSGADASCIVKISGDAFFGGIVKLSQQATALNCAIEFNGTQLQNFSVTGLFQNKIKTILNNSNSWEGIHLTSNVQIPDSLVLKKGYLVLNSFDFINPLPLTPIANPLLSYIVTNHTGMFQQKNVGISAQNIPIGYTTTYLNPLVLNFVSGVLDVACSVAPGLNPAVALPNLHIDRTWLIKPIGTVPSDMMVTFGYKNFGAGSGDGGIGFSYTSNNDVNLNDGTNWQIISAAGGVAPSGSNPYTVSQKVSSNMLPANIITPFAISNTTSTTSISNPINLQVVKTGATALLNWNTIEIIYSLNGFEIERSADGKNFTSIAFVNANSLQQNYSFTDFNLLSSITYYRIKMVDNRGNFKYSIVVAVFNKSSGFVITALIPNFVSSNMVMMLSSDKNEKIEFNIVTIDGKIVERFSNNLIKGNNEINIDCSRLPSGNYQIIGYNFISKTNCIQFIKR